MSQSGSFGSGTGSGSVNTLTGNTGGAVGPDVSNNINVVGTNPLTVTGSPGTNTLTVSLATPLTVSNGGTGQASLTNNSLLLGAGTSPIQQLGIAVNGALPIGSTGTTPVLATLTAGNGISITNGAGSITIASSGSSFFNVTSVNHGVSPYTVLMTDEFLAVDVSGGVVTIKLPNAPTTGQVWTIKDSKGQAFTNNITVTTVGGAVTIDGSTSFTMNTNFASISVIFDGTSYEIF